MASLTITRLDLAQGLGTSQTIAQFSIPGSRGRKGDTGEQGVAGPNLITDSTALGTLTDTTTPAFLLVGAAAGNAARKLTPSGWGLSNLLASVPAGRVPFADAGGLATSNAGLAFNSGTGVLSAGGLTATGTVSASQLQFAASGGTGGTGGLYLNDGASNSVRVRSSLGNPQLNISGTSGTIVLGNSRLGLGSSHTITFHSNTDGSGAGDTEAARVSPGFVGLGTPANKVSVGHDGTAGWVSTAAGHLTLAPWTGQIWLGSVGGAGMRSPIQMGLAENGSLNWTNLTNNFFNAAIDARIRRSSASVLDLDTGTDGSFADLRLRGATLRTPLFNDGLSFRMHSDDGNWGGATGSLRFNPASSTGYSEWLALNTTGTRLTASNASGSDLFGQIQFDSGGPLFTNGSASRAVSRFRGSPSQAANLLQLENNAGDVRGGFSPGVVFAGYDANFLFLRPGNRQYRIGTWDANGQMLFGREDSVNGFAIGPDSGRVNLSALVGDLSITGSGTGTLFLGGNYSGGTSTVEVGRRPADSSSGVGGHLRVWTNTGQSVPALSILAPGGGSTVASVSAAGRLGFATSDAAPANTTTPLLWLNVLVGGLTYKMPLYQ